jgi:2-polyprenyl-3-methyl-5-hydroxy-6-metoxy-1,4-benzoquinol methylase
MPHDFADDREKIMDYSTEPEVVFTPLCPKRYREFYDIELAGFSDDLKFYLSSLKPGMKVLDVGCGSGRLSRTFAANGMQVVGIDRSAEMLAAATLQKSPNIHYICMDMMDMALQTRFDAAVIAYNTLNLLKDVSHIQCVLSGIRQHLKANGLLLLQIFIPQKDGIASGKAKTFQFQIFNSPEGGKIIKETLKSFASNQLIFLEERYRVRPMNKRDCNEDLAHFMHLQALNQAEWIHHITKAGFTITAQYGDYDLSSFQDKKHTMLLLQAHVNPNS